MRHFGLLLAILGICVACAEATAACNSWRVGVQQRRCPSQGAPHQHRGTHAAHQRQRGGDGGFREVRDEDSSQMVGRWLATGEVEVQRSRCGPAPILSAAAILYLLCLSEMYRNFTLGEYQQMLLVNIGVAASDRVICAALKRLGQHRKAISIKKVEGLTPHGTRAGMHAA